MTWKTEPNGQYWSDVYGFKMNSMKPLLPEAQVQVVSADSVTGLMLLHTYDMMTVKPEDLDIRSAPFVLNLGARKRRSSLGCEQPPTGLCISFDCQFQHALLPRPHSAYRARVHADALSRLCCTYRPAGADRPSNPSKEGYPYDRAELPEPRNLDFELVVQLKACGGTFHSVLRWGKKITIQN